MYQLFACAKSSGALSHYDLNKSTMDDFNASQCTFPYNLTVGCLGGAAVRRRTRDRKVAGSTPGRGAIKSTWSTQPSTHPG